MKFVYLSETKIITEWDILQGFLEVAGVPLIDYVLESLALGGVGEAILFCCQNGQKIKEHVQ